MSATSEPGTEVSAAPMLLEPLDGGVCTVPGITAAGMAAGLKRSGKPDIALVAADRSVAAAAVQTRNQVTAAPVQVTARHAADGRARAVLLNSGSANVCTGPDGMALAERSAALVAAELGCPATDVLVCSTGVIGEPIASTPFTGALPGLCAALHRSGGGDAARAILTTDTFAKQAAVAVSDASGRCTVGGMAKGAGMLAPELATMLCVLTTDAPAPYGGLDPLLRDVVARTFGRISVDACMSTNDAVILLATGTAPEPPSDEALAAGLTDVCGRLAEAMVRDGEGAHILVRLRVTTAASEDDALGVARAVAGSVLFRTAIAGRDPNWGRVLAAIGAGPVRIDPSRITVAFGDVTVCRSGVAAGFDRAGAAAALQGDAVDVRIDLGAGDAEATFLTCDLSVDYVRFNSAYTT